MKKLPKCKTDGCGFEAWPHNGLCVRCMIAHIDKLENFKDYIENMSPELHDRIEKIVWLDNSQA